MIRFHSRPCSICQNLNPSVAVSRNKTPESGVTICVGGYAITATIILTCQRPTVLDGRFVSKHSPDQDARQEY